MRTSFLSMATVLAIVLAGPAFSEPLPKKAAKLESAKLAALYAGKSSNWSESRAYFVPDGTFIMIAKDKSWYADGKWSVKGNRLCANMTWHDTKSTKTGKHQDCWTYYVDDKGYISQWSGEKNKKEYWRGELAKVKKGDVVSAIYTKLKGK